MGSYKNASDSVSIRPAPFITAARLSDFLHPGVVKIHLDAVDKEEAFEELVDLLAQTGGVKDRTGALAALRAREALGTTGIGNGVAIPHHKHESIEKLVAAVGISRGGVEFDAVDGKPARVIFLLLASADHPGPHVQTLAEIAHLVQSPRFVDKLLAAKTPRELLDIIRVEEQPWKPELAL